MQATATRFPLNVDAQDLPTISQSTFDFYVLAAGCKQVGFHLLCHTSEQYVFLANCFKTISSDSTPVGQLPKWRLFQGLRCKVISSAAHLKRARPLMVETPLRKSLIVGDYYFSIETTSGSHNAIQTWGWGFQNHKLSHRRERWS